MFIPLLQAVDKGSSSSGASLGQLHYITDFIETLGFQLTLNTVLVIVVLLFTAKGVVKFFEQFFQTKVQQYFITQVQFKLLQNLREVSYAGFLKLDAGKIQNTIIAEVYRMSQAIKNYLKAGQSLFILCTYMTLAFLANYQFALLVVVSAGVTNIFYKNIYKNLKTASVTISRKGHDINAYLIEAVHHFKYLKSTNYFGKFSKKLKRIIRETEGLRKKTGYYNALTTGLREPMVVLIVVFVIYMQVNLMGGNLSSIILSLLLFYRGLNFLMIIQSEWQNFIQNTGALVTATSVSEEMEAMKEAAGSEEFTALKEEIVLDNVNFCYEAKVVLQKVNMRIPKNHTIALTGTSGSGKTTLANVIAGLVHPSSGRVIVDGQPLSGYELNSYRSKIGYISQESVIFNDTIFNNITFWSDPTPENIERFWEVVNLASLVEFVNSQAEKEQAPLGDNGVLISGGQRQRISIARELYKKPDILILDEATSSLDSETESIIQENVERLHGAYTMIIIAHRLSTIRNADHIYLLDKGKIVIAGNYADLMDSSNKFQALVSLQQL
jgi:subfamily B ATP-binding cassette protein MsbA